MADSSASRATAVDTLDAIRSDLGECTRCALHTGRTMLVFGVGNPDADLVFVGEAPGRDEDLQGVPFVGRAGQLLTKIIASIGLTRDEVYIANVVKCRPPGNRNPSSHEIASCLPFVERHIELVDPDILVPLGGPAAKTLLARTEGITRMRGRWFDYPSQGDGGTDGRAGTIPAMPIFHPAYLLRHPSSKRFAWIDLLAIKARLEDIS